MVMGTNMHNFVVIIYIQHLRVTATHTQVCTCKYVHVYLSLHAGVTFKCKHVSYAHACYYSKVDATYCSSWFTLEHCLHPYCNDGMQSAHDMMIIAMCTKHKLQLEHKGHEIIFRFHHSTWMDTEMNCL